MTSFFQLDELLSLFEKPFVLHQFDKLINIKTAYFKHIQVTFFKIETFVIFFQSD